MDINKGKIVFIGGHEIGREIVSFLQERVKNLSDVFVLDDDYAKKGTGHVSLSDLVEEEKLHKIRRIKDSSEHIKEINPDLIIVAGFSQIIPDSILDTPRYGTVGFHYAVLPDRRGCSPVIWALVDGLNETGVTMFYYNSGIDKGEIIGVERFLIGFTDDSKDLLEKVKIGAMKLLRDNLSALETGTAPRIKQEGQSIYTRKRGEKDGEISWDEMSSLEIYNLTRALRAPYPGAHALCEKNKRLFILGTEIVEDVTEGEIVNWGDDPNVIHEKVKEGKVYASSKDGYLRILETRIGEIKI